MCVSRATRTSRTADNPIVRRKAALALVGSAMFALTLSALYGCAGRPRVTMFTNLTETYKLALPSGEQVTITDAHGDSFEDVNHVRRHIYYIAYETARDFDDLPGLRQEAQRVWAAYLPQLQGIDYDTAVITPEKQDAGGSMEGRPFYLKHMPDGAWQLQ